MVANLPVTEHLKINTMHEYGHLFLLTLSVQQIKGVGNIEE